MIHYISTRGGGAPQTFEDVLLAGLAPDGGLYVPQTFPKLDLNALRGGSYTDIAFAVMYPFVAGSIAADDFKDIIAATYAPTVFRANGVTPLKNLYPNIDVLELFHGPTIAFKDVALQFLGRVFDHVLSRRKQNVTIVGATSGDTGSAAIEGCRHSKHVNMFILHPAGRVSDVQRKQMTTVNAPNVHNIALNGTFDDCQTMVKALFNDADFKAKHTLSAVNSINWARIMAQIVYYVTAALERGAHEDKDVSFVVPTGNFGNIFAAYCARKMGLPIKTLAIATNKNDILTRYFESGRMAIDGAVHPTLSPSMDIQISSNFERYLFDIAGRDSQKLNALMVQFKNTGRFDFKFKLHDFVAYRADDTQTLNTIRTVHSDKGYTLDPHTAVGMHGALQLAKDEPDSHIISLACAHPAKFPDAVERAINARPPLPAHLSGLFDKDEYVTPLDNDVAAMKAFIDGHV